MIFRKKLQKGRKAGSLAVLTTTPTDRAKELFDKYDTKGAEETPDGAEEKTYADGAKEKKAMPDGHIDMFNARDQLWWCFGVSVFL